MGGCFAACQLPSGILKNCPTQQSTAAQGSIGANCPKTMGTIPNLDHLSYVPPGNAKTMGTIPNLNHLSYVPPGNENLPQLSWNFMNTY